jgi:uncharacterized coiled-coil protein SlyX
MAGKRAEVETGLCYRNLGILCADGTCGHCDGARATVNKDERIAQLEFEVTMLNLTIEALNTAWDQTKEELDETKSDLADAYYQESTNL